MGEMTAIVLREQDKVGLERMLELCRTWCADHQAELGVAEVALGVAVVAWGVQTGSIQFGTDVVATAFSEGGIIGGLAGASAGGIGASILGSIGVVGGGVAFGIPALALASGGALILGAAGYAVGDIAEKLIAPASGFSDALSSASALTVGIALIVDGARRVITDKRVLEISSKLEHGVIYLAPLTVKIVARSKDELRSIIHELAAAPTTGVTSATAGTAAGAAIGGSLAAGSVTVLGSHGLGALALSMGLVSAPVWPVIAGGAAGLAVGLAAWKGIKTYRDKKKTPDQPEVLRLPKQ